MPTDLSTDKLVDLKIAHLNMVQGAVTRMAGFSASAKTFCITILAAIIALAVQAGTAKLALGAIVAVICLGLLDLYYLTLELRFRAEEHTSELHSLMRISYAVLCLKKKQQ